MPATADIIPLRTAAKIKSDAHRVGELRELPLAIIGPRVGLRVHTDEYVQALAAEIELEGLRQPIEVMEDREGVCACVDGFARLAALRSLEWETVPAWVMPYRTAHFTAEQLFNQAVNNLRRRGLTALERMEHLVVAKSAHGEAYGRPRKPGRKMTREAEAKWEISSRPLGFASTACEAVGLTKRHVNGLIRVWDGLSSTSRERLRPSWLADKLNELKRISELPANTQSLVLDMMVDHRTAATVEDALARIGVAETKDPHARKLARASAFIGGLEDADLRSLVRENHAALIGALKAEGLI